MLFADNANAISKDKHADLTGVAFDKYLECIKTLNANNTLDKERVTKYTSKEDELTSNPSRLSSWHFYDAYYGTKNAMNSNTSLHKIYAKRVDKLLSSINDNNSNNISEYTGRVLHYIQDMTVPAHVAPIYHSFGNKSDPFDDMSEWKSKEDPVEQDFCQMQNVKIMNARCELDKILQDTAEDTRSRIKENIPAPSGHRLRGKTWEEFWVMRDPKNDNQYSNVKPGFAPYGKEKREGFEKLCKQDKIICKEFFDKSHKRAISSTVKALLLINELNSNH